MRSWLFLFLLPKSNPIAPWLSSSDWWIEQPRKRYPSKGVESDKIFLQPHGQGKKNWRARVLYLKGVKFCLRPRCHMLDTLWKSERVPVYRPRVCPGSLRGTFYFHNRESILVRDTSVAVPLVWTINVDLGGSGAKAWGDTRWSFLFGC